MADLNLKWNRVVSEWYGLSDYNRKGADCFVALKEGKMYTLGARLTPFAVMGLATPREPGEQIESDDVRYAMPNLSSRYAQKCGAIIRADRNEVLRVVFGSPENIEALIAEVSVQEGVDPTHDTRPRLNS